MALMMVMVTSADHPGSCHFIEATRTRDIEKAIESLLFSGTHVVFLWLHSSSSWFCSRNVETRIIVDWLQGSIDQSPEIVFKFGHSVPLSR